MKMVMYLKSYISMKSPNQSCTTQNWLRTCTMQKTSQIPTGEDLEGGSGFPEESMLNYFLWSALIEVYNSLILTCPNFANKKTD